MAPRVPDPDLVGRAKPEYVAALYERWLRDPRAVDERRALSHDDRPWMAATRSACSCA